MINFFGGSIELSFTSNDFFEKRHNPDINKLENYCSRGKKKRIRQDKRERINLKRIKTDIQVENKNSNEH